MYATLPLCLLCYNLTLTSCDVIQFETSNCKINLEMLRSPSALEVKKLYKEILRYGQKLQYTDKEYFFQRIKKEFKTNKALDDETQINFNYKVI